MIVEIKVPSPGESISEVEIANWLVGDGDYVEKDQEIAEVESDKATLPLIAEEAGTIKILAGAGETRKVGDVVCRIDTSAKAPAGKKAETTGAGESQEKEVNPAVTAKTQAPGKVAATKSRPELAKADEAPLKVSGKSHDRVKVSPVAARMMQENGLSIEDVVGELQRITKKEVQMVLNAARVPSMDKPASREEQRQKMSRLRRKLSERLVAVKNETAMLTTFNECDMSEVVGLRKRYQEAFVEKHGVKLGFMSFFVKAVTGALQVFPNVNSWIEGEDVVTPEYCDVGIAVQTEKGLMVPVLRNAESMSLAEIEAAILALAGKARAARISLEDMSGGTFTITNGGVFGSMLSTPLLNPPQSAILGMHNIQERPVAIEGKIEIRPMMYLALSYDHRLIDGRDSVSFLVKVKELIEDPVRMMFGGMDPEKQLLDI